MSNSELKLQRELIDATEAVRKKFNIFKQRQFADKRVLEKIYEPITKQLKIPKKAEIITPPPLLPPPSPPAPATPYLITSRHTPTTSRSKLPRRVSPIETPSTSIVSRADTTTSETSEPEDDATTETEKKDQQQQQKVYSTRSTTATTSSVRRLPPQPPTFKKKTKTTKQPPQWKKKGGSLNSSKKIMLNGKRRFSALKLYHRGHNKDYIYWNHPSELIDRLRLLYSSKNAGHKGHDNEILSIIEELYESGIIY